MSTINLTARQFAELMRPVVPHAAGDRLLPILSTVLIETDGKWLSAMATDRYTLGIQRIEKRATDDDPATEWPEFKALVPLRSVKALLALFKPSRNAVLADMSLTVEDDKLVVEGAGGFDLFASSRFTYFLETGEYPNLRKAILGALASTSAAAPGTAYDFAPSRLARFAGLRTLRMAYGGRGAVVTDDDGFLGAVMPRRAEGIEREDWTDFLAEKPEPKKATPRKRTTKAKASVA